MRFHKRNKHKITQVHPNETLKEIEEGNIPNKIVVKSKTQGKWRISSVVFLNGRTLNLKINGLIYNLVLHFINRETKEN